MASCRRIKSASLTRVPCTCPTAARCLLGRRSTWTRPPPRSKRPVMATTAAAITRTTTPRRLYVGIAVLAIVIAAVGFWRTYFGPLLAGGVDKPAIIHFHAAIYVG